jgi:thiol-disulfide isomerase/thioredoxin
MDQHSPSNRLKEFAWPAVIAVAVTLIALVVSAIVVKSPRLASTESPVGVEKSAIVDPSAPQPLAQALLPPKASAAAFDTPFFNAKSEKLTLNSLKGQGIVLNFWATWCPPCIKEMPALDNLSTKLKDRGVQVIALSEDRGGMEKVPAFYAARDIRNLDVYLDLNGALSRQMGIEGLPTTVLIDAQGREVGRVMGVLEWDADVIADYLAQRLGPQ